MTVSRTEFEDNFPTPDGVHWSDDIEGYVWDSHPNSTAPHDSLWMAWDIGARWGYIQGARQDIDTEGVDQ